MSHLVADQAQQRHAVELLAEAFQQASVEIAPAPQEREQQLRVMPAGIHRERSTLIECTALINTLLPRARAIAWFANPDQSLLTALHGLMGSIHHLHQVLFNGCNTSEFAQRGLAITERQAYKLAVDDLKEVAEDLNEQFFIHPQDAEFQELMNQLNDLDHFGDLP